MHPLLRRASISSSLRSKYRNTELRIISSSLDPKLTGRAHILLPCSLPHFRFGSGPVIRPYLRIGPFFSSQNLSPTCRDAHKMDRLSLCLMHSCYDELCIADQTVKTYIGLVAATPLRNLLPRTRVADNRVETESSSLGFGSPVRR